MADQENNYTHIDENLRRLSVVLSEFEDLFIVSSCTRSEGEWEANFHIAHTRRGWNTLAYLSDALQEYKSIYDANISLTTWTERILLDESLPKDVKVGDKILLSFELSGWNHEDPDELAEYLETYLDDVVDYYEA